MSRWRHSQRANWALPNSYGCQLTQCRAVPICCHHDAQGSLFWGVIEFLAARTSFSQERMQYLAEPSEVFYRAKDGTYEKAFDALEWLAAMCSHIPVYCLGGVRQKVA